MTCLPTSRSTTSTTTYTRTESLMSLDIDVLPVQVDGGIGTSWADEDWHGQDRRVVKQRWYNFGGFEERGAKTSTRSRDQINERSVTEPIHPATLGCVASVWMPSAFGMMVCHPMVHGFRLW